VSTREEGNPDEEVVELPRRTASLLPRVVRSLLEYLRRGR
jgi:hypothetical protein